MRRVEYLKYKTGLLQDRMLTQAMLDQMQRHGNSPALIGEAARLYSITDRRELDRFLYERLVPELYKHLKLRPAPPATVDECIEQLQIWIASHSRSARVPSPSLRQRYAQSEAVWKDVSGCWDWSQASADTGAEDEPAQRR